MANLTVTAVQVAAVFPTKAVIHDFIANSTITAGQPVYQLSTGKVAPADANGSGLQQFRGIALNGGAAGQAISVLLEGHCYGFTLTSMNYDALAYLSDDVGRIADGVGTMTVNVGRVVPLSDSDLTKVLYITADWLRAWA